MFDVFTQINTLTSFEYWSGIGYVLTIQKWGRIRIRFLGLWYEVIPPPNFGFMAYQQYSYVFTPPCPRGYLRAQSQAEIDAEAELQTRREAERLQEMREEAGWIEGYTYEEEEEPDFWTFFKQLSKETEEGIEETLAMEEHYMISRFDFH